MTTPRLKKAEEIILANLDDAQCGLFNTRNIAGDEMVTLYKDEEITVDICYGWSYFEVFGLTKDEFANLYETYEWLRKNNIREKYDDMKVYDWEKVEQPTQSDLCYTKGINIGYVRGAKAVFELVKDYIPQPIYEKLYEEYVKERINEQ